MPWASRSAIPVNEAMRPKWMSSIHPRAFVAIVGDDGGRHCRSSCCLRVLHPRGDRTIVNRTHGDRCGAPAFEGATIRGRFPTPSGCGVRPASKRKREAKGPQLWRKRIGRRADTSWGQRPSPGAISSQGAGQKISRPPPRLSQTAKPTLRLPQTLRRGSHMKVAKTAFNPPKARGTGSTDMDQCAKRPKPTHFAC